LAEYTWLPAGADAGVAGKYAKARTKGAELDLLEAEIIDDIKNKIPGYARTVAPVNAVIETSKDKIMAYAKKHPFTALLASAPLGLYTLLGYSAAFSIAAPPIVGAACVLGKWDQAVNAFKDSALVAKSVLSDAAATALPIGVLFATASVCNGNTDHVREIIGTGVAIHTVSLLYNNRSNIQKNALTFAQSAANRVLNTTKAWFKEGWTRGPLLATGGLAAVASSYVYGQELYSKFALGAGMIAIALQLTASALINLSEAKV
jgi:hypothetical protein